MEGYLKQQNWNISATTDLIFPKFETYAYMIKPNLTNIENVSPKDDLEWKMTSNGKLPKITKFVCL